MGRQGRRHKQLLDGLKEEIGYSKLKEETLDRIVGENSFWKWLWTFRKTRHGINECMIDRIERKYLENILSQFHFARHKSRVGSPPGFSIVCIHQSFILHLYATLNRKTSK
jgi:hypothetical protein